MRSATVVATAIFISACVGCSQGPLDPWAGLAHPDTLGQAGMKYYWTGKVKLYPGESIVKIHRLDENLYCQTSAHRIIAVDASTGVSKWVFESSPNETIFPPVHADGVTLTKSVSGVIQMMEPDKLKDAITFDAMMFNTESYVVVINRETGEVIRKPNAISFGFAANCRGSTNGAAYYVGSADGRYAAFRLQEGVKSWTMDSTGSANPIAVPVVYLSGRLYVANENGTVVCADVSFLKHASKDWSAKLDGPIRGGFHVDERGCFVPSWNGWLCAFDYATGKKLWDPVGCHGLLREPVQVGASSVFQYAQKDKLYAIDIASGKVRWSIPDASSMFVMGANGENVWLKDSANNLLVVNEMSGAKILSLPLTGHEMFVPNTDLPVVYTAKADGRIFCMTPTDTARVTREMLRAKASVKQGQKPSTMPATAGATAAPSASAGAQH
jgi:outer membrane protein assembly factor BamB